MRDRLLVVAVIALLFGCANHRFAAYQAATSQAEMAAETCEQSRVNGALKTYVEAANCANFATTSAFRQVNYPFMDLINIYTAAQLVGAERVDARISTPGEARYQLAELRSRLSAEAERRFSHNAAAQQQAIDSMLFGLSALQPVPTRLPIGAYELPQQGVTCIQSGPITTCR